MIAAIIMLGGALAVVIGALALVERIADDDDAERGVEWGEFNPFHDRTNGR